MTPGNLLRVCSQRGIRLAVVNGGEELRVEAPEGALTPHLRQSLKENKAAILAIIEILTKNEINELYEIEILDD